MRRAIMLVALVELGLLSEVHAAPYDWTISASSTDPFVNTATVPPPDHPIVTYYLWLACCNEFGEGGMSAATFDIVKSPPRQHTGATAISGFVNSGTGTTLELVVGGCPDWLEIGIEAVPDGEGVVGDCKVVGNCPRLYCRPDGFCYEVFCTYPCPESVCPLGVSDCSECEATATGPDSWAGSWGRVKGLYRWTAPGP